ncbi:MAG: dual specificity protein phosphatase family protein [Deltaproteobacteria bacterium]|nr:dual specificity protein phosphatase family protein [Deltaproteobacteria bacterium]
MKKNNRLRLVVFTAGLLVVFGCGQVLAQLAQPAETARPAAWAIAVEKEGLPNLHKVSDALYRGAQPEDEGYETLEMMGGKALVNLRSMHSGRSEIKETKIKYNRIVFNPFHPEDEDLIEFLKIMADPKNHPVFVHCKHGSDRTGMMVVFYRIVIQGWTKEDAIKEMKEGGFGFHSVWKNLILFIQNADIEKFKKAAGIESKTK